MMTEIKLTDTRVEKEVLICGLIALTVIQVAAFMNGINGVFFATIMAIIGAIVGVTIPLRLKA